MTKIKHYPKVLPIHLVDKFSYLACLYQDEIDKVNLEEKTIQFANSVKIKL